MGGSTRHSSSEVFENRQNYTKKKKLLTQVTSRYGEWRATSSLPGARWGLVRVSPRAQATAVSGAVLDALLAAAAAGFYRFTRAHSTDYIVGNFWTTL